MYAIPARRRSFSVPLAVAAAVVAAVPLAAQAAGASALDRLPASSYAAVAFAGLDECSAAVKDNALARVVLEFLHRVPQTTFDARIGQHLEHVVEELRDHLAAADLSPATVRAVLQRPMALGLGRLTIRGMGPSLALVVEEGNAAAEIDAMIDHVARALAPLGYRAATVDLDGTSCRSLQSPQGPPLLFARQAGTFVATNSEGYLREIFAACKDRARGLAAHSSLGEQRAQLGGRPIAEFHANTGTLLTALEPLLPYEAGALGDALGIGALAGIYGGVAAVDGGTVELFDVALRGSAHGMLKAAFAGPADFGAASFCSADTLAFATLRCNVPATFAGFDALLGVLPDAVSAQVRPELRRELTRALRHMGTTPAEAQELLAAFGGTVSVGMSLAKGAPLPEVIVALPVKNRAVAERWLDKLTAFATERANVEWKTRDFDGATVRYFDVPARGVPMPVTPALVLLDDHLLIGSQPRVLGDALKQRGDRDSSLAATADFAAAVRANPNASLLLHLRQGRALELGWRLIDTWALKPLDAMEEQIGFGRDALPEQEELVRAAGATTIAATVDEHGVRISTRGSFGAGALLLGGAGLVDELLQRASGKVY